MHRMIDYLVRLRLHITFYNMFDYIYNWWRSVSRLSYAEMFTYSTSYYKFTKVLFL